MLIMFFAIYCLLPQHILYLLETEGAHLALGVFEYQMAVGFDTADAGIELFTTRHTELVETYATEQCLVVMVNNVVCVALLYLAVVE